MKFAALIVLVLVVCAAAVAAVLFSFRSGSTDEGSVVVEPLKAFAAPPSVTQELPSSWVEGLAQSREGEMLLLSCEDKDGDGSLTGLDRPDLGQLQITLGEGACDAPGRRADVYLGVPSQAEAFTCSASTSRPLLIVAIASAGSDLLDPSEGESMGVLSLVNTLQERASFANISSLPILTAAAIFGSEPPQGSLERYLAHEVARRLGEMPCLRAVVIGHSHGGATVSAVTAALDAQYADRVFGVMLDRTTSLYDRHFTEFPARIRLLNVYQLNEGWHGNALNMPNVYDIDQSYERAPLALSDGGGGLGPVSHKTLDDSIGVQSIVANAVMTWLTTDASGAQN